MARRRREPRWFPIAIEVDGKKVSGEYAVDGGNVKVSSDFGFEATHVGSMPPEALAKMLLGELVAKKSKKKS